MFTAFGMITDWHKIGNTFCCRSLHFDYFPGNVPSSKHSESQGAVICVEIRSLNKEETDTFSTTQVISVLVPLQFATSIFLWNPLLFKDVVIKRCCGSWKMCPFSVVTTDLKGNVENASTDFLTCFGQFWISWTGCAKCLRIKNNVILACSLAR